MLVVSFFFFFFFQAEDGIRDGTVTGVQTCALPICFYLAMHDLEIRGAGEVLGESQSGEMQQVGFSLYARMLDRAVRKLKAGKGSELEGSVDISTEVNLHVPALLPASYCSDVPQRLSIYKRLADADSGEALDLLREELVDRFGE